MAAKLNEALQAAIDRKAALIKLLDEERTEKGAYSSLLERAAAGTLAESAAPKLAEAKARVEAFGGRVSAARHLVQVAEEEHAAEVRAVAEAKERAANAGSIEVGVDHRTEKPFENFGVFVQAVHRAQTGRGMDPRLFQAAATGMGEAVGADGGFAVPIDMEAAIEKNMWEQGAILSRVSQRPVEGNIVTFNVIDETSRVAGSRSGGVLGYWVDEGTAPDATKIKLAKVEMKLRKVAALGYLTDELMQDAPALAAELEQAFTDELVFQVEDKIVEGTGAGSPQGILGAACTVSVAKETGQAAATILMRNLSRMWARLPARSKAGAVWLINVDCEPQLDELSLPVGTAALEPRFVAYGPDGIMRIKGRPVIPVEYCATVGTTGDIMLCDLSRYRVIRKASGVTTARSIHVRFTQGELTLKAEYRVDGQPIPRSAITPFKGSNTLSPFVKLDTRA